MTADLHKARNRSEVRLWVRWEQINLEYYNILNWKGLTRVIDSNSWVHTGPTPKSEHMSESIVQMLLKLWQPQGHDLWSLFSAWTPSQ